MDVTKYQCSHCNTLYDQVDHCPTCGSLSEDAILINYTQNIKTRRKELALDTYFNPVYKFLYTVHFFTCISWLALWLSIPTTILHLFYIFVIQKKGPADSQNNPANPTKKKGLVLRIIRILDMVLCVPSFLAMIAMLLEDLFLSIFFF